MKEDSLTFSLREHSSKEFKEQEDAGAEPYEEAPQVCKQTKQSINRLTGQSINQLTKQPNLIACP
jgi:hypothetical protein